MFETDILTHEITWLYSVQTIDEVLKYSIFHSALHVFESFRWHWTGNGASLTQTEKYSKFSIQAVSSASWKNERITSARLHLLVQEKTLNASCSSGRVSFVPWSACTLIAGEPEGVLFKCAQCFAASIVYKAATWNNGGLEHLLSQKRKHLRSTKQEESLQGAMGLQSLRKMESMFPWSSLQAYVKVCQCLLLVSAYSLEPRAKKSFRTKKGDDLKMNSLLSFEAHQKHYTILWCNQHNILYT